MSMVVKYGGNALDAGNVRWTQNATHNYDERARRRSKVVTVTLDGFLKADTQAELKTKIEALEDIFANDGGDLELYHTDGTTLSAHKLTHTDSISGVTVVSPVSYPNGAGVEYATERTYTVTLQAEYSFTHIDDIVSWQETIRVVGIGGLRRVPVEYLVGAPEVQIVNQQTVMYATQAGSAIGWTTYPLFPGPSPTLALFEQTDRRQEQMVAPHNTGRAFRNYGIAWSYEFIAPAIPIPNPRAK